MKHCFTQEEQRASPGCGSAQNNGTVVANVGSDDPHAPLIPFNSSFSPIFSLNSGRKWLPVLVYLF